MSPRTEPIENDDLIFAAEDEAQPQRPDANAWKVLIVDDDLEVHRVTKMVLDDFEFAGKRLAFMSAHSGAEARTLLEQHPDIALVLLDVVMETEDAGLRLAQYIREELHNHFIRIVLRTGQPGQAPEEQVILQYDINDYKSKTELTVTRLFTTVIAALRAYRDILTLNTNKRGLETILKASASIFEIQAIERFAQGVLTQLTSLLHFEEDALYAKASGFAATGGGGQKLRIFSGTGSYADLVDQELFDCVPDETRAVLERARAAGREVYLEDNRYIGFFRSETGSENILYLQGPADALTEWDHYLLEIFCRNVAIAFDNISLNNEIRDTQREIILKLGEIVETRSRETGNHVKRVAEYSCILAEAMGIPEDRVGMIRFASPMHDVGKIGVPDAILNKPAKLTPEEFDIMKRHTVVGYEMLRNSPRELLRTAAVICHEHHEKYDGTGYPRGLKGDAIDILGRITAVADVFDALGVKRAYKDAWPIEKILEYFRENRGTHFDPALVDLFFEHLDRFLAIRDQFPDVTD